MDTTAYRFRWRYIWLALLVAALLMLISACTTLARDQLYAPGDGLPDIPEWVDEAPELVSVTTADDIALPGYYWAPDTGESDIILVLHGRRDNYARMAGYIQRLQQDGRGVLVASYRGFRGNPGTPNEAGLIRDAQAFYRLARERAGDDGDVYVFGHSLGGGVAVQLAAREELDGLITLATFSTVEAVAPFYADPFIPDPWDSVGTIGEVEEPMMIVHGADDTFIRPANARALYEATCTAVSLAIIEGVRHKPNFRLVQPIITGWINALEAGEVQPMQIESNVAIEHKAACA